MTYQDLQNLVSKITYKPNYKIDCCRIHNYDAVEIIIYHSSDDSEKWNLESRCKVVVRNSISIYYEVLEKFNPEDIIEQIRFLLINMEKHEINEWYRFDGVHVTDPHPELKN